MELIIAFFQNIMQLISQQLLIEGYFYQDVFLFLFINL